MRNTICSIFAVCGVGLITMPYAAQAQIAASSNFHLRAVPLLDDAYLAQTRQTCAEAKMPAIKRDMDADARLQHSPRLPEVDIYCRAVVAESIRRGHKTDLYVNLALQEQGYDNFHSVGQAQLLQHNEAWRTTEAILRAANAGQSTYQSFNNKTRDLFCPLALDAGATWASGNVNASAPVELTAEEADAIAHQCYEPTIKEITVRGATLPATKAGLILGVWLAKHP